MSVMWEETEKKTLDEELHGIFSVRVFFFVLPAYYFSKAFVACLESL